MCDHEFRLTSANRVTPLRGGKYPDYSIWDFGFECAKCGLLSHLNNWKIRTVDSLELPLAIEDYKPAWDENRDQEESCLCGHPYRRHFDPEEHMNHVGCKYCYCDIFQSVDLSSVDFDNLTSIRLPIEMRVIGFNTDCGEVWYSPELKEAYNILDSKLEEISKFGGTANIRHILHRADGPAETIFYDNKPNDVCHYWVAGKEITKEEFDTWRKSR